MITIWANWQSIHVRLCVYCAAVNLLHMMYTSATQVESSSLQVKADAEGMEQTESQVRILNSQTMATAREIALHVWTWLIQIIKNILCQWISSHVRLCVNYAAMDV